jgi:hypothetical protein
LIVVCAAEKYTPLIERTDEAVVESRRWLSPVTIGVGYVKRKFCTDCCVAANTTMSLFLPAPVLGANVLKSVSDVQVRDSAGEPENFETRDDANMSMLALRIVNDVDPVVKSNFQIPNEFDVRRLFKEVAAP